MATTWQDKSVIMIRAVVGDLTTPYTYSDGRLTQLFLVASQLNLTELTFEYTYVVDIDGEEITPDPVDDNTFINMTVLRSACILRKSELWTAAGQAISIRDGTSAIELGKAFDGKKFVVQDACKAFEDAKWDYQAGNSLPGRAILGPFSSDQLSLNMDSSNYLMLRGGNFMTEFN